MGQEFDCDNCIRRRIIINDEYYYITVGKNFVMSTVPYENRSDRENERLVVETICAAITDLLEEINQCKTEDK